MPLDDVLSDLESLTLPREVDPALFELLKDELARGLQRKGVAKIVALPPEGELNKVCDLALDDGGDSYVLSWRYRNLGDYDQNGTVGISDITPIAMHFGEEVPEVDGEPDDNSLLAVIDGSGNGEVDIADITPLAQNFGVCVEGYRIEGAQTEDGWFGLVQKELIADASGEGRLEFSATVTDVSHLYYRVVPFDDNHQSGVPSDPVLVPGDPPEIVSVSPLEGTEGEDVGFDAEVVSEVQVSYTWNFGGGATPNISSDSSPTVTMNSAGEYEAALTTSSVFGTDVYEFMLVVHPASPVVYSVSPTTGDAGQAVQFSAIVTGTEPITYSWDFGGGAEPNTSSETNPLATLSSEGEYEASLTAENEHGIDVFDFTLSVIYVPDYEWNFAVYLAGDNNLAEVAFVDIDEMEVVGSTGDVAINVEVEAYDEWGEFTYPTVERFMVVYDDTDLSLNTTGHPANESFNRDGHDSASIGALTAYLDWSLANFKAFNNALILWDHGVGWDNGKSTSGIICDDTSGTMLADYEIAAIMEDTGAYWELLAMDACVMGSVEVAYEYRNVAHYLVFSQEGVPYNGFYYTPICDPLTADPSTDALELAQIIVDTYVAYYAEHIDEFWGGVNLAIVDLTKMDGVVAALDDLAQSVIDNAEAEEEPFTSAAADSQYTGSWLGDVDALDFLQLYRNETANTTIQSKIDAASAAIEELIVYENHVTDGTDFSHYHGISLWVPDAWDFQSNEAEYQTTSFCNDALWFDMLDAIIGYSGPTVPADFRVELSWDTDADVDLWLEEPDPWDPSGYSWNAPYLEYSANGVFSPDSLDSGQSLETWTSNSEVMPGYYTFAAEYWWDGEISDYANVNLKLWEDDELTHDETVYMDYDTPYDEEHGYGWYTYGWLEKDKGRRRLSRYLSPGRPRHMEFHVCIKPKKTR